MRTTANDDDDGYFGLCPTCHRTDGFINVGADHWFVCAAHRVKWHVGGNLFSSWRDETHNQHLANAYRLAGFRAVKPYHPRPLQQSNWPGDCDGSSADDDIPF